MDKKTLEFKVQITGRVLISIERALKSLGQVGINILAKPWSSKFKFRKNIPIKIRTKIFDSLLIGL